MILPVVLLSFLSQCYASIPAQITPFALPRRQIGTGGETCGYENANVLSSLTCAQGSSCAAQASNNVAGGCCRLGDGNCVLATACIASAENANCNSDCQSNSYVTKCSDAATPYCYTRYWISGAVTPSELGCTTTQGYVGYAYNTYTGFGAEITPVSVTSVIPTPGRSGSSGAAAATGSGSGSSNGGENASGQSSGNSGESGSSSDGGGGGVPAGAIAGGVVGGVAVLGIVAAVIVWMILRHRKQQREKAAVGAGPANDPSNSGFVAEQKHINNGHGDAPLVTEQTLGGGAISPAELSQHDAARPWELGGQKKYEVQGHSARPELP